ncbi:CaiB/BaiF CoA transferase family protein [Glutamicibacter arilaitensis]|uniref:CaiB/BaiF CoA transferase family protein n=1 Tax=Glutamicibacter arilaitensis TaxID=256701 RepID=UPI00384C0577
MSQIKGSSADQPTNAPLGALHDIRVLDLTQALAGPFCTSLLGDQGAQIIKVEPARGDMIRYAGPFAKDAKTHDFGNVFQNANRNKRSLVLDLKSAEGQEVLLRLVAQADVLVENFSSGVMERLGLDYERLSAINPKLVYTSIRGFGDKVGGESPYGHWPAFDIVAQAMGGLMSITGKNENSNVRVGSGVGDTVPGLYAAFGTMAALLEAKSSGRGQYVDVAMVDAVLAVSEVVVNTYDATGVSPQPMGNELRGFAPFNTVAVKDGEVALGAPHNPQWSKLCTIMGREELITDPRFDSDLKRWNNKTEVYEIVEAWTSQYTRAELTEILGGKVPLGPVLNAEAIFADPHFAARQMLCEVENPRTGRPARITGPAVKLGRTPASIRHRAPLLGEHSREVLLEAGLSDAEINRLVEVGATTINEEQVLIKESAVR